MLKKQKNFEVEQIRNCSVLWTLKFERTVENMVANSYCTLYQNFNNTYFICLQWQDPYHFSQKFGNIK